MNELTFSGDIVIYMMGLAITWGGIMWRIAALEKKVDKHNSVMERTAALEARADALEKAGQRRI
jgi:hypothetical protein